MQIYERCNSRDDCRTQGFEIKQEGALVGCACTRNCTQTSDCPARQGGGTGGTGTGTGAGTDTGTGDTTGSTSGAALEAQGGVPECINTPDGKQLCIISCMADPDCPAGMKCWMKADVGMTPASPATGFCA